MRKLFSITLALAIIVSTLMVTPLFASAADPILIGFEDGGAELSGTLSDDAAIVTTTASDGLDTKALHIVYDGLGKGATNAAAKSTWILSNGNKNLVDGSSAAAGFDFKIDGTYSKFGTYQSRSNPANPTLFSMVAGQETTPLVAARFTRERTETGWGEGPETWEIMFTNGRLNWIGSGVKVEKDTWVSINLTFDLTAGTYDAYVNGVKVKEGLKIGNVTDSNGYISNATAIKQLRMTASTISHYNADVWSTWGVYIDNISFSNFADLEYQGGKIIDDNGNVPEKILPVNNPVLTFNNNIVDFNLTINGTPIADEKIVKGSGSVYTIKHDPFEWGTEYTIEGTATDLYGSTDDVELTFTTAPAVESMIEVVGFFNADGKKITELESGDLKAKLRFWQSSEKEYTYMMALYKEDGDKVGMINLTADAVTTSEKYVAKELTFAVPDDFENCYAQIIVWDNLTDRNVYTSDYFYGQRTIR